jgi:outer membrane protein OmpA-like peptidoglycan-associated protein
MRRLFSVVILVAMILLHSGCASKTWVQDLLDQRDAGIDQRLVRIDAGIDQRIVRIESTRAAAERETAERTGKSLQAMEERVNSLETLTSDLGRRAEGAGASAEGAQGRAEDAHTRATKAYARAEEVDARLTRLWSGRNARVVVNTLYIEFGFDRASLDDAAKSVLVVLVRELRENPELGLDLEGYTDSKGSLQYNVRLSQRRVDAVRGYLVENGVERHRIKAAARGPSNAPGMPEGRQRRVAAKLVVVAD